MKKLISYLTSNNISVTMYQTHRDRYALVMRDEDIGKLITRIDGEHDLIQARFDDLTAKLKIGE